MLDRIIHCDKEIFLLLNGAGSEMYDTFWIFVSSTKSAIPLFLLIIFLLFKKHGTSFWQGLVLILIVVSLADLCSVHCFKNVFMRLRPSHAPELVDQIRLLVSKGGLYGFVSSHAANMYVSATILGYFYSKQKRLFFTIASLVAFSRVYVGVHYPADIVFGGFLGYGLGWITITSWVIIKMKNLKAGKSWAKY